MVKLANDPSSIYTSLSPVAATFSWYLAKTLHLSSNITQTFGMSAFTQHEDEQNCKDMDHTTQERASTTFNRPVDGYRRPLPRLPFCAEYDGVNLRKTKTISQSIQELMEIQRKAREDSRDDHQEVVYKSTQYFDRILEDEEIAEQACGLVDMEQAERETDESDSGMCGSISTVSGHPNTDTFGDTEMDTSEDAGTVDLQLEYMATSSRLVVNVIRADDVKNRRAPNKLMNTFVKVSMYHGKNSKKQKTSVVRRSLSPVFNQKIYLDDVIEKWMHIMCLRVQLYEKKLFRKACIGETLIWVEDLELAPNKEVKLTKSLRQSCS